MGSIADEPINESLRPSKSGSIEMLGRSIGPTGYGLMGLTWRANMSDLPSQETSFAAMNAALESGANFWDGGEIYGKPERNSLHLLNEYFLKYPEKKDQVVISIKGGTEKGSLATNGTPENTRRSIDECLTRLGDTKKVDVWQSARVDQNVPIEVTMREAAKYVESGKIGGVGLSECSARSIRRAAKITKVVAVEVEFSLWETSILKNGVAQACAELGIPIIAYSPLGRGFLTGQFKKPEDIPDEDFRKPIPRFQGENFYKNLDIVHQIQKLADKKKATPGQVALAWVRAMGQRPGNPTFIPIPGASSEGRVRENMKMIELSDEDMQEIDGILSSFSTVGDRYPPAAMSKLFGDSPEEHQVDLTLR